MKRRRFALHSHKEPLVYEPPSARVCRAPRQIDDPSHPRYDLADDAALQKERRKLGRSAEPASREQRKALGRRILLARQSLRGAGKGPVAADSAAALQLGALDVAGLAGDEDPPFASALGASATAGGVSGMDTS